MYILYMLKKLLSFINSGALLYLVHTSKAFDRIDHWELFKKLLDKNVPLFIIMIPMVWYCD